MPPPWHGKNSFSFAALAPYWNYSIAQDFESDGVPAAYAPGHPQTWDVDEVDKIVFQQEVAAVAVNAGGELLAFAVGNDVIVYATKDRSQVQVLKGHMDKVTAVAWSPADPRVLVSCTQPLRRARDPPGPGPRILIWNIEDYSKAGGIDDATIGKISQQAILNLDQDITDLAPEAGWTLSGPQRGTLAADLTASLAKINTEHLARGCTQLEGKLVGLRANGPISPDGQSLAFLPCTGTGPRSNGNVPWDLSIFDLESRQMRCTLTGHTDNILCIAFSHDSSLVGTASWDGTFRIWQSSTGAVSHIFEVPNRPQNWTAGFSPDGELFAGTAGSGHFYVWGLQSGDLIASFEFGASPSRWCRTLDWSPDSRYLAVGGQNYARVMVVEPRAPEQWIVQNRRLSVEACDEGVRRHMDGWLETTHLRFLPDGRYALKMGGDRGVEVYDFASNEKMRFAPPHSEEEQSGGWGSFVFCPREGLIASLDEGAMVAETRRVESMVVRFWKV